MYFYRCLFVFTFFYVYFTMALNPRDWVRGCRRPRVCGAKSIVRLRFWCFAPFYSPILRRGAVGNITRINRKTCGINHTLIFEHPDHQFLVVLFFNSPLLGGVDVSADIGGNPLRHLSVDTDT